MTIRFSCLLLVLLSLAGCAGDTADTAFEQYLQRLGRTLDTAVNPPTADLTLPRLPRPGQLRLPVVNDKLGTLDFLELRGCALQTTIGKANSSLGRLARDSQKLLLALEFLRLAPDCVAFLEAEDETELATTLTEALAEKRAQLPALIFNATLGSEEFAAFWRPGKLQPAYPGNTSSAVITALEEISAATRRWLAADYQADNMAFELQLSAIATGDGGQLWKALAHQGQWLTQADAAVQQSLQRGPLCPPGRRPAAAEILPNVVEKFFIRGIQPRAADLGRRYHQLLPPVSQLEHSLASVLPQPYKGWQQQREQALAALSQHPREHVSQLQQLLSSCERNP